MGADFPLWRGPVAQRLGGSVRSEREFGAGGAHKCQEYGFWRGPMLARDSQLRGKHYPLGLAEATG